MIAGKKCRKERNKIHTIELRQKVHNLDKHDANSMQVTPSHTDHTDHICKSYQVTQITYASHTKSHKSHSYLNNQHKQLLLFTIQLC